jgi:choline dehydrogenase
MFDTTSASTGVKFALLEGQLLTRKIDRSTFVDRAADLGLPPSVVAEAADKFLAIAANQAARRRALLSCYDYIVIGSGASGSVVATERTAASTGGWSVLRPLPALDRRRGA